MNESFDWLTSPIKYEFVLKIVIGKIGTQALSSRSSLRPVVYNSYAANSENGVSSLHTHHVFIWDKTLYTSSESCRCGAILRSLLCCDRSFISKQNLVGITLRRWRSARRRATTGRLTRLLVIIQRMDGISLIRNPILSDLKDRKMRVLRQILLLVAYLQHSCLKSNLWSLSSRRHTKTPLFA